MTTKQITPCLWFDKEAEEAAMLYTSIFKNSKIGTVSRYGKEGFEFHHMPEGTALIVTCELNDKKIMCLNGGPLFKFNPSISFFVTCKSIDETNEIWNKLFEGGKALMPIDKYAWSERYGWLQDRFGLTWQISYSNNSDADQKITPSFLFTAHNFGRAEEAIQFYTAVFKNSSVDMLAHYAKEDKNAGKILYAEFTLNKNSFIAMDGPGVHDYSFNEAVSLVINCENQEEIDYYWNKLTEGGSEGQCGWLKDKFGVSWQVVPTILEKLMSDKEKSGKVMRAFLQMKKFDIEILVQA